jgi:hypothetical protein
LPKCGELKKLAQASGLKRGRKLVLEIQRKCLAALEKRSSSCNFRAEKKSALRKKELHMRMLSEIRNWH